MNRLSPEIIYLKQSWIRYRVVFEIAIVYKQLQKLILLQMK